MTAGRAFAWALVYARQDILHLLVEEGGPAGLPLSEVARLAHLPTDVAEARLRGLALAHEAELRHGRWYATTRGAAVVTPPDDWADVPF